MSIVHQTESAFQKQSNVFIGNRQKFGLSNAKRYVKNIGLGFPTPAAAHDAYVDNKCPFTGNVSIRGRILRGIVISNKMKRTVIVRRDYLHYIPKYKRYEKRNKHIAAHVSPCFRVNEGDIVTIGQCRPLSKTIRFNVIAHQAGDVSNKKKFTVF